MAHISVHCEFPDYTYSTPEGDLAVVVELLKMHVSAQHKQAEAEPNKSTKVEKAKRPEITLEMTDGDWAYFISRWSAYKKASGVQDEQVVVQLMECCGEQLRKEHFRSFPNFKTSDLEEDILKQIRQVAVRAKNQAVNRYKLHTAHQGVTGMNERAQQSVWWPGISPQIQEKINKC